MVRHKAVDQWIDVSIAIESYIVAHWNPICHSLQLGGNSRAHSPAEEDQFQMFAQYR